MTATSRQASSALAVRVKDKPLPADVASLLVRSYVDDHLKVPDTFVLEFRDPNHDVLERIGASIGTEVSLSVASPEDPGGENLLDGEITAVETDFGAAGSMTFIRGYDKSHRLLRGRNTESWTNVTLSDVVRKIAQRAGVGGGDVKPTTTVMDHVVQPNVSDWEALLMFAEEAGYEVAVRKGKLDFRPPSEAEQGPTAPNGTSAPGGATNGTATATADLAIDDPLHLTAGTNLLRFRAVMTSAEQVEEVRVRSWDYKQKQLLEGVAPAKTAMVSLGDTPAVLAKKFGAPALVAVRTPFGTMAEVDAAAKALAERVASRFATLEGVATGSPKLRAGTTVTLGGVGKPFEGKCVLTTTRHRFDPDEGYTTSFTASGAREDSILGLTGGDGSGTTADGVGRFNGVVPALVTDVRDPDGLGRVKLTFPWLSDSYESDWARVVQAGAGPDRGAVVLPEVRDEVLVAFEQGDIRRAYVVGSLYNGVDKPRLGDALVNGSTGAVGRRGFVSRKGSSLVFLDEDSKEGVALLSSDKGLKISLNKTKTTIRISSDGNVEIEGSREVSIKAGTSMAIEAQASMSITAGTTLELHGTQVKVTGDGPVQVQGTPIQLN